MAKAKRNLTALLNHNTIVKELKEVFLKIE